MRVLVLGTVAALLLALGGCGSGSSSEPKNFSFTFPNPGMQPTFNTGTTVTIHRARVKPTVGEIIAFYAPTTANPTQLSCSNDNQGPGQKQPCDIPPSKKSTMIFVERVVGLPGDRIAVVNGHVIRNGVREKDPYISSCGSPPVPECSLPTPIVIPAGHYYLMGDNRGDSNDSRFWGPLPQAWIIGTVTRR